MPRRTGPGRVVVAVDPAMRDLGALELAADLASRTQAHLLALFVEDVNLFHLAELPFARELDRSSGFLRPLESSAIARAMQADVERVRKALVQTSHGRRISWELKIVRGQYVACAIGEAAQHDLILLNDTTRIVFDVSRRPRKRPAPVWVFFDGSAAAERALGVARELCRERRIGLIVLVPAEDNEALRGRVRELLGDELDVQFRQPPAGDRPAVFMAAAREECGLLLVPRGAATGSEQVTDRFLRGLRCPLVLVA